LPLSTFNNVNLCPEIDNVNPASALQNVSLSMVLGFSNDSHPVLTIRSLVLVPLSRRCGISTLLHSIGRAGISMEQLKIPRPLRTIESGAGWWIISF
jgi:hypothetical protein